LYGHAVPGDTVKPGTQADRLVAGAAVLCGRYTNGKVWAISAKNSATGNRTPFSHLSMQFTLDTHCDVFPAQHTF
jgi:hypothetical protein